VSRRVPILILLADIESGVTSWAFRLKRAMAKDPDYEVTLLNCWPMNRGVGEFDKTLTTEAEFGDYVRSQAPCIVVPNFFWEAFPICANLVSEGHEVWTLGYCRADSEEEYYAPLRWLEPLVGRFIPVSHECAEHLATYVPDRSNDSMTMPTGIDVPGGLDRSWQTTPIRLVYGGRMAQLQKRVMDFAPLVKELHRRGVDFRLTLVGGGSDLPQLQQAIEAGPAADKVTFTGTLSADAMDEVWEDHDVFVQLSDFEGTSNSMLEAMARGCVPVVTRASSGIDGVVQNEESGYVVEVGDMAAMADRIQFLAKDTDSLAFLGNNAYRIAREHSIHLYAINLRSLLRELQKEGPRPWPAGDARQVCWRWFRGWRTPLGPRPRFLKPPFWTRARLYPLRKLGWMK